MNNFYWKVVASVNNRLVSPLAIDLLKTRVEYYVNKTSYAPQHVDKMGLFVFQTEEQAQGFIEVFQRRTRTKLDLYKAHVVNPGPPPKNGFCWPVGTTMVDAVTLLRKVRVN